MPSRKVSDNKRTATRATRSHPAVGGNTLLVAELMDEFNMKPFDMGVVLEYEDAEQPINFCCLFWTLAALDLYKSCPRQKDTARNKCRDKARTYRELLLGAVKGSKFGDGKSDQADFRSLRLFLSIDGIKDKALVMLDKVTLENVPDSPLPMLQYLLGDEASMDSPASALVREYAGINVWHFVPAFM